MRDRLTELKTEKVIARCECVTRRRREWPLRAFILHTHTHTLSLSHTHTHTHTHTLDQQEHLEVALADSRKSEGRDMASGSSSDRDAAVAGGIDLHSEIQKLQKELASQKALAFDLTGERDSLQKEMHELRSKHGLQQSGTGGGASSSTTPAKREMEALEAKLAHALQHAPFAQFVQILADRLRGHVEFAREAIDVDPAGAARAVQDFGLAGRNRIHSVAFRFLSHCSKRESAMIIIRPETTVYAKI